MLTSSSMIAHTQTAPVTWLGYEALQLGLGNRACRNTPADDDFSRSDIGRARREAMSLVRESRYGDAAGVLAEVAVPASRNLGAAPRA